MSAKVLDGKNVVVTGASKGIGKAIALALVEAGLWCLLPKEKQL